MPQDRDNSDIFLRRALIAPLILVIVAFFHSARVAKRKQSPWKGGGFGMFSTVDTVGSRFLRVYLATEEGEIAVEVPTGLKKRAKQLCAAPNAKAACRLAKFLVAQRWGHRDQFWTTITSKIQPAFNGDVTAEDLRTSPATPRQWQAPAGTRTYLVAVKSGSGFETEELDISAARVEVWKYEFNRDGTQLQARRIVQAQFASGESPDCIECEGDES